MIRQLTLLLFLCLFLSVSLYSQTPTTCNLTAAPVIVHSEGVAERLGDILLACSGTPGVTVNANLIVILPAVITNRINSSGFSTDANITINQGAGPMPSGVSGLVTNQTITFNGVQFTFPSTGLATLVIDDLRVNINALSPPMNMPIEAQLGGTLLLSNNPVVVAGFAQPGLLATTMDSGVTCVGSPEPATVNLSNLFSAGTVEQTTRVTEGFASSFQPKDPTSDTGTRFLLTYSGFPADAKIYVPDAVAGSSALSPTSGGDLGTRAAVGQYQAGSPSLLLVRVLNADATGAGGTFATLPAANGSGVLVLNGAQQVPLTNGAGYVVYEVVSADSSATESAQIPNFFGIPPYTAPAMAAGTLSLAPVSSVGTASTTAPIPRFAAVTPPSDCQAIGDCNASYFPKLMLKTNANPFNATAVAGAKVAIAGNIMIDNTGGGVMDWAAGATYGPGSGSGWVFFTQAFGIDGGLIQVAINATNLTPGTYQAVVTIDAGTAGSQSIPLNLTVTAAPVTPGIVGVTNAANFAAGPVVPGSLATIWGTQLNGQKVSVTFNEVAAVLLYTGAQQINLRVPPTLTGVSAQMVVNVDGVNSAPFTVDLTTVAPAIFTPGVLNQNNTVNSASSPAPLGSVLQIFGTGLPDAGGVVTVSIQGQGGLKPLYAGAAPGLPGVQQVNVAVPANLDPVTSELIICAAGAGGRQVCSQAEAIALKQ